MSSSTNLVVNDGWEHLEGLVEVRARTAGRHCWLARVWRVVFGIGVFSRDSYIDYHAVLEVLEPRDEGGTMAVLEDYPPALIQAIEVLDSGDYRISRVVRVDVDSHR
jgi:hypothetical protein